MLAVSGTAKTSVLERNNGPQPNSLEEMDCNNKENFLVPFNCFTDICKVTRITEQVRSNCVYVLCIWFSSLYMWSVLAWFMGSFSLARM